MYMCITATVINLTVVFVATLSCIIGVVLIINGTVNILICSAKTDFVPSFKIIYTLNNICWLCSLFGYTSTTILPLTRIGSCLDPTGVIPILGFFGYVSGLSLLFVLFVIRLKRVFEPTPLKLSPTIILSFCALSLIMFVFQVFTGIFWITYQWQWAYVTSTAWLTINLLYCFLLLVLFVYKTYRLHMYIHNTLITRTRCPSSSTRTQKQTNTNKAKAKANKQTLEKDTYVLPSVITETTTDSSLVTVTCTFTDTQRDEKTKDLLSSIWTETIKCVICICVALLTTTAVDFMSIYRGYIAEQDTPYLVWLHCALDAFDSFINVLCLQLQFKWMQTIYNVVCFPVYRLIKLCVLNKAMLKWSVPSNTDHVPVNTL